MTDPHKVQHNCKGKNKKPGFKKKIHQVWCVCVGIWPTEDGLGNQVSF